MKSTLLIASLMLASLAMASAPAKVLLVGKVAEGSAKVIIGEMTITAHSITHDATTNQLRCSGSVQIRNGASVVRASDCTVELGAGSQIYRLDPAGVRVESNKAAEPAASAVTANAELQKQVFDHFK